MAAIPYYFGSSGATISEYEIVGKQQKQYASASEYLLAQAQSQRAQGQVEFLDQINRERSRFYETTYSLEEKVKERDREIEDLKSKIKKLKRKVKHMSDGMSIQVYDPLEVEDMGNDAKQQYIDKLDNQVEFLKVANNWDDKKIDEIKMKDINKVSKEAADKITIGRFKHWMKGGIKEDPVIAKIGNRVREIFSKRNAEFVIGLLFIASIATLILKLIASATKVQ